MDAQIERVATEFVRKISSAAADGCDCDGCQVTRRHVRELAQRVLEIAAQ